MKKVTTGKLKIIYTLITLCVLVMFSLSPIPQDPGYHDFADQRALSGIANFWNVISNLPFIIVSYIALTQLLKPGALSYPARLYPCYLIFFISIGTVGLGSAYYHLQPDNETLFWDRLPMTVGFMAFAAIITGEYISEKIASDVLYPFILAGTASVVYWYFTEQAGHGDLRPYGFIQFAPMLIIPVIMIMFPARYTQSKYLWAMMAAYLIAKVFEFFDIPLYNVLSISGHTIKHLLAATGPYLFLLALKKRQALANND